STAVGSTSPAKPMSPVGSNFETSTDESSSRRAQHQICQSAHR
ncbi:MAG: hypothetical protein ACI9DE_002603, partial [Halioglobus sp.]